MVTGDERRVDVVMSVGTLIGSDVADTLIGNGDANARRLS